MFPRAFGKGIGMQNFLNEIQDKFEELGDTIRSALPYSVQDKLSYCVPITVAGISAAAIVLCISANANANSVDSQAKLYQEGQAQLTAVLGQEVAVKLSTDAEEIMGRADLFLQYPELSRLEGDSVFTSMEKMANVSEDAEEDAAEAVDNAFYDSIIEFAGAYGGVLVRNPSGMSDDVKLAAYEAEADMESPEISGVSNILVKQIRRTIDPQVYGEKLIKNTLTILSGNDISNFSSIKEGSVMYLLLGESTGSKRMERYICTGIEPGTIEGEDSRDEERTIDGSEEKNVNTAEEDVEVSGSEVDSAEMKMDEKGLSALAERNIALISATSGDKPISTDSNGTVTYADGTKVERDGTVVYSDGTIVEPDGTVIYPDGMTISPDGEISGASIPSESKTGGNESGGGEHTSNKENEESSDQSNSSVSSGNSGYEEPETLADADLPTVLSGGGINIENDEEHSVILYSVNSRTGSVTITYWDVESEQDTTAGETESEAE